MKKLIITSLLVAAFGISANAQFYIGGSIGIGTSSNNNTTVLVNTDETITAKSTATNFYFTPEVGYQINEKNAVGLGISLIPTWSSTTEPILGLTTKGSNFGWKVTPYYRYKFWSIKNFGIWGQAQAYIGGSSDSYKYPDGTSATSSKTTNYGVGILPVISYNVTKHLSLVGTLNFLTIGYAGSTVTYPDEARAKNVTNSFTLGFNNGNTVNFGVFYNF